MSNFPVLTLDVMSTDQSLPRHAFGAVRQNVRPFPPTPHVECEWYFGGEYRPDGGNKSLLDVTQGELATPRGAVGSATWPTVNNRDVVLPEAVGGAGLLLPIPHVSGIGHTVMMVFELPAAVSGRNVVLMGDAGDHSPVSSAGQFLYMDQTGTLYTDRKGITTSTLNKPPSATAGDLLFFYYSETPDDEDGDAYATFRAGFGNGAASEINAATITQTSLPIALGNRYVNSTSYRWGLRVLWAGQAASTKSKAQCLETYAKIKENLGSLGLHVL